MGNRWGKDPDGATPFDPEGLLLGESATREDVSVAEAENIAKAHTKYLVARPSVRMAPFDLRWAYQLHREMFGKVWEWAGQRRNTQTNIGCPVEAIDPGLKNLLDDLQFWIEHNTYEPLEQSVRLHHRAVQIHPFRNGNGRWSRLLANVFLKQSRLPIVKWPEQTMGSTNSIRGEYLKAIRSADEGSYDHLLDLHWQFLEGTIPARGKKKR